MAQDNKYRRNLKAGETLFHQGDHGDCAYVIESGQLEVFRGRGTRRKVMATLGPGDVIGEMAIIDNLPRTASALARKPTRLRVITQEHLQSKLASADPLVRVLLRLILNRYRTVVAGKRGHGEKSLVDRKEALKRIRLGQELEIALERQQFQLYFQPIVRAEGAAIAGFEALVRWNHPQRGVITPYEFIPLMEESGLIVRLGQWTLHTACQALMRFQRQPGARNRPPLFMGINISGREIETQDILVHVDSAIAKTGVDPKLLRLEITESALVNSLELAGQVIGQIRDRGAQIAVDDFGTGYSSLNYLRHFSVDTLKIDRSFVKPVHPAEDNRKFLRTIRDLAHALNMTIVAEGIETLDQARLMRELGLEFAQGYLFARPMQEDRATAMLNRAWPWEFEPRMLHPQGSFAARGRRPATARIGENE